MNQIYFLSVLFNMLAGLVLAADYIKEKISGLSGLIELIDGEKSKFVIGACAFIIGVLKLLVPLSRTGGAAGWLILGDFLPAVGGVFLGFSLLIDYLKQKSVISANTLMRLDTLIIQNKNAIGFAGMVGAALHFLLGGLIIF